MESILDFANRLKDLAQRYQDAVLLKFTDKLPVELLDSEVSKIFIDGLSNKSIRTNLYFKKSSLNELISDAAFADSRFKESQISSPNCQLCKQKGHEADKCPIVPHGHQNNSNQIRPKPGHNNHVSNLPRQNIYNTADLLQLLQTHWP